MNQSVQRISELITRQLEGTLSQSEKAELEEWIGQSAEKKILLDHLNDSQYVKEELEKFYAYQPDKGWEKIHSALTVIPERRNFLFKKSYRLAAAIVIGLLVGSAVWMLYFSSREEEQVEQKPHLIATDIAAPSAPKAMIVLQDGSRIALDSLKPGVLTAAANTNIQKKTDGSVVYQSSTQIDTIPFFNTLINPRGSRTVQLTLSDGTRVWLNVDSEIKYPVSFSGQKRKVEVRGEVYFEVTADKQHPFEVTTGSTTVEVTGTHFNVNAYRDEELMRITLLEGAVQVSGKDQKVNLRPGEQAQIGSIIQLKKQVDTEAVMAWKKGLFSFQGTDIHTIMRQLSRWYDVDVHFEDTIHESFYGDISRDNPVSKVLDMLETTGSIHFKTKDKTIEVTK